VAREAHVIAHAKVNLELLVLAREGSGYHALQTVFHRLEIGDLIRVRVDVAGRTLDCAGPEMPSEGLGPIERNLAWRAAEAYMAAAGWPAGFEIAIEKRIPAGGGLGGGSADAGAVLRALDALNPHPLGGERLLQLATPLGADVPFLTTEQVHALAWSRGERLLPLDPLPERPVALLLPPFPSPTAEAYRFLSAARGDWTPTATVVPPAELLDWDAVARRARNDFQPVLLARHPQLGEGLEQLRRGGARLAMLAGSGSTLFGVFDPDTDPAAVTDSAAGRVVWTRTLRRVVGVEPIG